MQTEQQTKSQQYALLAARERACPEPKWSSEGSGLDCLICNGTGRQPLLPQLREACDTSKTITDVFSDGSRHDQHYSPHKGILHSIAGCPGYTVVVSFTALLAGLREGNLIYDVLLKAEPVPYQEGFGTAFHHGADAILLAHDPERAFLEAAIAATEDA